ncbi:hypothetical protein MRX96_017319 [Rhipicephalus microplus]
MLKPTAVPSLFPASPDPRGQDPMPRKKRLKRTQGGNNAGTHTSKNTGNVQRRFFSRRASISGAWGSI